jgi:hypothetical protein
MALLPDHACAAIPEAKLRYVLDPFHASGRHKARVFASALGIDLTCPERLEEVLRVGIAAHEATLARRFVDGAQVWVVEWPVGGRTGPMRLLSVWHRPSPEAPPPLVSCYLKEA